MPTSMPPPSIAAVIPLYNGAKFIETALRSVFQQTLAASEIIVVDDGSTDDGAAVVRKLASERAITLLQKPNGGQSSARNMGVANATSTLIALLDQDDRWYPNHLEKLVQPFRRSHMSPPLGWTYSNLDEVDTGGNMVCQSFLSSLPVAQPKRNIFDCLRTDMFILPSASLLSRQAFNAIGGFDERLLGYEDDDLFLRMFRAGYNNLYIDEALSQWRIYPESSSYSPRMARSRMIYARKMFEMFPDDAERARWYRRDLLAPRFYLHALREYRRALLTGDLEEIRYTWDDLVYIAGFLSPKKRRRVMRTLRLMKSPVVARAAFNARDWLRPLMIKAFG